MMCRVIDAIGASAERTAELKRIAVSLTTTIVDEDTENDFLRQCMQLPPDKLAMLAAAAEVLIRFLRCARAEARAAHRALDEETAVAELEAMLAGVSVRSAD
jgi:hypothetical protein